MLYLSDSDVALLELRPAGVKEAVTHAFQRAARGYVKCEPKAVLQVGPGHTFQSLSAIDVERGYAAIKWIGQVPPGERARFNINASILLSDVNTGQLLSLMGARDLTAIRTAGMSAAAAEKLARRDARSLGLIGAGTQAESHLNALAEILPGLERVIIHSRSASSAERLAQRSRDLGFDARVMGARETVMQSEVLVSTVPLAQGFQPFLDPAWIPRGALVIAVDLGRSWLHAGLDKLDMSVVDEDAMRTYAKPGNFIPPLEYAQATLADLADGRSPGRASDAERIMFFSSGSAVADLAIAILAYERALALGRGEQLPS